MEKTKKITKRQMYNEFLALDAVKANPEMVEFLEHQIELLDKKNATAKSGDKKLTALQKANEALKEKIVARLSKEPDRYFTCTEIAKIIPELNGATPQKVAPLMNALVKAKVLESIKDRKTYFRMNHEVADIEE